MRSNAVNNAHIKGTLYCRRERTKEEKQINETLADVRNVTTKKKRRLCRYTHS